MPEEEKSEQQLPEGQAAVRQLISIVGDLQTPESVSPDVERELLLKSNLPLQFDDKLLRVGSWAFDVEKQFDRLSNGEAISDAEIKPSVDALSTVVPSTKAARGWFSPLPQSGLLYTRREGDIDYEGLVEVFENALKKGVYDGGTSVDGIDDRCFWYAALTVSPQGLLNFNPDDKQPLPSPVSK